MEEAEPAPELKLSEHEKAEVVERIRPRAQVLHEAIRLEGENELNRPKSALAWSGLAAGLSMGFSLVAMGLVRAALPRAPWSNLLVDFGYAVGFVIVIVARQQLFTENTLTPILPLLQHQDRATARKVLRLWAVVLSTNLLGTFLFALVAQRTSAFSPEVKAAFAELGRDALAGGFASHFIRAVFSGWLIALMVWMLPGERSRIFLVVAITYLIGVAGFSHVIAGSVECFYAVLTGDGSLRQYLGDFLAPVLLGNILGGSALVGALNHAQVAADVR